jgi:hypothetical protein
MMRLLELGGDGGNANPQRPSGRTTPAGPTPPGSGKGFPVAGNTLVKPARNSSPVDLEQLQARIDFLENRLQNQAERLGEQPTLEELERLRQHMRRLEQDLETELWAAQQREHTLLELLSRPPLKQILNNRLRQFWQADLPAAGRWIQRMLQIWWLDAQPEWWPRFARAWQESLDKARR